MRRIKSKWPLTGIPPMMYASTAHYPMKNHNVIDIGLCIIKCCGMYYKEYKKWIACENKSLPIVESIESLKEYWVTRLHL